MATNTSIWYTFLALIIHLLIHYTVYTTYLFNDITQGTMALSLSEMW